MNQMHGPPIDRATQPKFCHRQGDAFIHFFVNLKQLIVKVGTARAFDLIKTSLFAQETKLSVPLFIFDPTLSSMKSKVPDVILPTVVGRPKYLSVKASTTIPVAPFNNVLNG